MGALGAGQAREAPTERRNGLTGANRMHTTNRRSDLIDRGDLVEVPLSLERFLPDGMRAIQALRRMERRSVG